MTLLELETNQERDLVAHVQSDLVRERCRFGKVQQVLERERQGDVLLEDDRDAVVFRRFVRLCLRRDAFTYDFSSRPPWECEKCQWFAHLLARALAISSLLALLGRLLLFFFLVFKEQTT